MGVVADSIDAHTCFAGFLDGSDSGLKEADAYGQRFVS
jgi:hypothetical protein